LDGVKRALLWIAAVLAAALGVWLYARDPRGLTYFAHTLLVFPLYLAVLDELSRRLPYRLQWGLAIALAVLGPLAYLVWMNDQWWLYGALAALPFVLLAEQRAERRGEPGGAAAGADPWSPP
jgi:hypothetical protein